MKNTMRVWILVLVVLVGLGVVRARVQAAADPRGNVLVSIPYTSERAGDGRLVAEILDPEDHVLAHAEQHVTTRMGSGVWEQRLTTGVAQEELVWDRLRFRFAPQSAGAVIEGIVPVSAVLRRPVVRILAQPKYLAGSLAAVRVIVADAGQEGAPESGTIKIALLQNGAAHTLYAAKLDQGGSAAAEFRLPAGVTGKAELRYTAETPAGTAEYTQPIELEEKAALLLTAEKPLYQPGQVIHLRALALDRADHRAVGPRPLVFEVEDARGNKVFRRNTATDAYGVASAEFALADEVNLGTYHVHARLGESNEAELAFNVERYVLPKFKVAVEFAQARQYYKPGEHVTGTVRANYFFGKPVDHAEVSVKLSGMDVEVFEAAAASGRTDAEGAYKFDLVLPAWAAGQGGKGSARALVAATVKDAAAHSEVHGEPVTVSAEALLLTAVPEGGTLVRGLDNQVFVLASYPDGKPAAGAALVVTGTGVGTQRVRADAGGVALVHVRDAGRLQVEADDRRGSKATAEVQLETRVGEDQVLLRTSKAVVKAGDSIPIEVFSTRPNGTAYLDMVKDGQTVMTRDLELVNGHAQLTLVATPEMAGTLDLDAYVFGRDAQPVADHRLVFVQPAEELRITAASDLPVYKPGAQARIRFHVANTRGEGVSAALGLQIVDEAVFALAEKQPGFAKVFFYLEQEVLKPRYEIHSLSLADAVSSDSRELESRALFAATALAAPAKVDVEFGRTLPDAHYEEYKARYDEAFHAQVQRVLAGMTLPEHADDQEIASAFRVIAKQRRIVDSWGAELRVERAMYLQGGERYFQVRSAGPDHAFDTEDDLTAYIAARTGTMRGSKQGTMHGLLQDRMGIRVEHDRGPMTRSAEVAGKITDAAGAVIPGALVTLRGLQSDSTREAHARADGSFSLAGLAAGRYKIEISMPGFSTAIEQFNLEPRDLTTLDVRLTVQAVNEMVMVENAIALPAIPSPPPQAMAGMMVEQKAASDAVRALPLLARSFAVSAARPVSEPAATHVRSYFPEALYINPEIVTDKQGNASIELPVADSITTWRMAMTASTKGGALGSATGSLQVFQDFFADLDLPVTLTQGDRITVPVALYNYTSMNGEVSVRLEPAEWYTLESDRVEKQTSVASGRVGAESYSIAANRIGKFKLTLTARMGSRRDIVVREIEVVPNGREQSLVANGHLDGSGSAQQQMRFPAASLADATTLFVRLYPGPLSQVIEGMDGILQMPGGCFEQTSSSTYPNVLALDYMKRTRKLTPEIHAKAEGYIANGYQRLLTFEVRGGGFSWFGEAPANKILTAYGLMEFNDMSKVADVDPKVIERTREWLISQQQPDGSWKPDTYFINEGATTRFNTNVLRITAYLAWALANTGYEGPATDRAKAYLEAHHSGTIDAYTLAVIANFAADYKQDRGFTQQSMQALLQARTERGDDVLWSAEETGLYGSGESAAVETTGLAVQALLKGSLANDTVRKALHYLTSKKSASGNWGTTQATIMALKALLTASERGSADVRGTVQVVLNGRTMETLALTADNNDLLHQFAFHNIDPRAANEVQLKFSGTGGLAYQIAGRYFVPWEAQPAAQALAINVAYDRTTLAQNDVATAIATVHNNLAQTANMVMVDLGIPPGFELLTEDLQAFEDKSAAARTGKLEKFSLTATQAILYFNAMGPKQTIALKFRLRARYPIHAKTFASRVYEYYDPQVSSVARPIQLEVR